MECLEVELDSWGDIRKYDRRKWIYRGQSDARLPLSTALERCCVARSIDPKDRHAFEDRLFREFRRGYHQYASRVPTKDRQLEWFSIMQHHGSPTRLLDFTYSIYVAAYFALERSADGPASVWALNSVWAHRASLRQLGRHGKDIGDLPNLFTESEEPRVSSLIFERPQVAMAWPINPFYLTERLRLQKGVFLASGDISQSMMDNLAALADAGQTSEVFLKIVIPQSLRMEALRELFHMNISQTTLFPGLDGYAKSLGVYHPTVDEPVDWGQLDG